MDEPFRFICDAAGIAFVSPDALQANRDYLEEVRRVDINRVDGITRDPDRVGRFLRSCARAVGSGAYAFRRDDDVWVVPKGVCGP